MPESKYSGVESLIAKGEVEACLEQGFMFAEGWRFFDGLSLKQGGL